jgi:hypothetical protein
VSLFYAAPDTALFILAAVWSYRISDRRIAFWKTENGSIYSSGGIIIYLIYLAGLVARLAVDYLVIGPSAFTFGTTLSQGALIGATATDLIIMLGVGLLIGRNLRIYKRYTLIMSRSESPFSSMIITCACWNDQRDSAVE